MESASRCATVCSNRIASSRRRQISSIRLSIPFTSTFTGFGKPHLSRPIFDTFRAYSLELGLQVGYARHLHVTPVRYANSKFSYGIAASYAAKNRRYNPARNVFNFDPNAPIIKRRKDKRTRPDSGQDAFFISRVGKSGDVAFGVADGVGGWVDSGVDPADFSHGFCDYAAYAASTYSPNKQSSLLTAQNLMQNGYDAIAKDETVKAGGSTACVGIAKSDGSLDVANLGDSGFLHLRLNAVHDHSDPQTHAFNTPYQLSIMPERMRARAAAFGSAQLHDLPKDATVTRHSLRHGDVLIFATDGVWDNLSIQDTLRIVSRLMEGSRAWENTGEGIQVGQRLSFFTSPSTTPEDNHAMSSLQSFLAAGIASEAKAASVNTKVDGPFAREVQRYYPNENWRGGKLDDICVLVAIVLEAGR